MLARTNQLRTLIVFEGYLHVVLVLAESDELVVGVVVSKDRVLFLDVSRELESKLSLEVSHSLVLQKRVNPSVVDPKSDQVDLLAVNSAGFDGTVLGLKVLCKLGTVMTTVRLGEEGEVAALVGGEGSIEILEELPNVFGRGDGGRSVVGSVRKANACEIWSVSQRPSKVQSMITL